MMTWSTLHEQNVVSAHLHTAPGGGREAGHRQRRSGPPSEAERGGSAEGCEHHVRGSLVPPGRVLTIHMALLPYS